MAAVNCGLIQDRLSEPERFFSCLPPNTSIRHRLVLFMLFGSALWLVNNLQVEEHTNGNHYNGNHSKYIGFMTQITL